MSASSRFMRRLTLIELVVVLAILISLGGIIVPALGNFFTRSHVTQCATNISEVTKLIELQQLETGKIPNAVQTGVDINNAAINNAATLVAPAEAGNADLLLVDVITAAEEAALIAAGCDTLIDHPDSATLDSPTFFAGVPTTLDGTGVGASAIFLSNAQALAISLPADPTALAAIAPQRYVWFGLGPEASTFGTTALEAPVHFGDDPNRSPTDVYSRYGFVVQLADDSGNALEVADFKRSTYCLDGENFETIDNHVEIFWDEVGR